jgi:Mn2+/Fe2+ NRAMP family transporter
MGNFKNTSFMNYLCSIFVVVVVLINIYLVLVPGSGALYRL